MGRHAEERGSGQATRAYLGAPTPATPQEFMIAVAAVAVAAVWTDGGPFDFTELRNLCSDTSVVTFPHLRGAHTARLATKAQTGRCSSVHKAHLGTCHCQCVFIDVGMNRATEFVLPEVLQRARNAIPGAKLDALENCINSSNTCYYGFEANPYWTDALEATESNARSKGLRAKIFTGTAFNTHGGHTTFYVQPPGLENSQGSTLEASEHPSIKLNGSGWRWTKDWAVNKYAHVNVSSTDAGEFLAAVAEGSSFVAIKIDIEGFEYTLIPHLLLNSPAALCAIDVAALEWHERHNLRWKGYGAHLACMLKHQMCGVDLVPWY